MGIGPHNETHNGREPNRGLAQKGGDPAFQPTVLFTPSPRQNGICTPDVSLSTRLTLPLDTHAHSLTPPPGTPHPFPIVLADGRRPASCSLYPARERAHQPSTYTFCTHLLFRRLLIKPNSVISSECFTLRMCIIVAIRLLLDTALAIY
jgi:hypothetical protein